MIAISFITMFRAGPLVRDGEVRKRNRGRGYKRKKVRMIKREDPKIDTKSCVYGRERKRKKEGKKEGRKERTKER